MGQSNVLLLLSSAVEAGDTVTVDYTVPDGDDFIRDIPGQEGGLLQRAGGHERHGVGPTDGEGPRRAAVP